MIVAELLKLICKAFWSATYMGIPDMLLQQEQFVGWMTCIHTLMDMPVPKARLVSQLQCYVQADSTCGQHHLVVQTTHACYRT